MTMKNAPTSERQLIARVPASEAWLFRNRKALDSVRRGLEEVAEGRAKVAGSFAKFADGGE